MGAALAMSACRAAAHIDLMGMRTTIQNGDKNGVKIFATRSLAPPHRRGLGRWRDARLVVAVLFACASKPHS